MERVLTPARGPEGEGAVGASGRIRSWVVGPESPRPHSGPCTV